MSRRTPSGLEAFRDRQTILDALAERNRVMIDRAPKSALTREAIAAAERLVPRLPDDPPPELQPPIEPAGPVVAVSLYGREVLAVAGPNSVVSPMPSADRAAVAAALASALATSLAALATDLAGLSASSTAA